MELKDYILHEMAYLQRLMLFFLHRGSLFQRDFSFQNQTLCFSNFWSEVPGPQIFRERTQVEGWCCFLFFVYPDFCCWVTFVVFGCFCCGEVSILGYVLFLFTICIADRYCNICNIMKLYIYLENT